MITVYSAICGNYDKPRDDVRCFTAYNRFRHPRMNAKIYKVLAHKFVNTEYSIWIDGSVRLLVPPEKLVDMMGPLADCGVFRHCERDNIYDEANFVALKGKDDAHVVAEQIAEYRQAGFIQRNLGMCGVIVRRHTEDIARRNERWWSEICRHSVRDQISFPVVFDGAVRYFDTVPMNRNQYFMRISHQK